MGKKVISLKDLKQAVSEGKKELCIDRNTILTPSAKDYALTGVIKLNETLNKPVESCSDKKNAEKSITKNYVKELVAAVAKEKKIDLCDKNLNLVTDEVYKCINNK